MKFAEAFAKVQTLQGIAQTSIELPKAFLGKEAHNYLQDIAKIAASIPDKEKPHWIKEWALAWRKIYENFDKLKSHDPMMFYQPKNKACETFHKSRAFVRRLRTGNRCGKTQAGFGEHYFRVTGYNPYREKQIQPSSTLVVAGLPFSDYAPKVFEKKMLYGEDNNFLSPIFPENGKWFYHYDPRRHIITIACPDCAEKGKAQSCPSNHIKTTIALATSEKGKDVLEAFAVGLAHGDEHLPEEFFAAMQMRIGDAQDGCLIFTGTPLHGTEAWEITKLDSVALGDQRFNKIDIDDQNSQQYVSLHTCSMFSGGIVTTERIQAYKRNLDEFEFEARIMGNPAPIATNPVFNRSILKQMRDGCFDPEIGIIDCMCELQKVKDGSEVNFIHSSNGSVRIWRQPEKGVQYICAVDTAAGLSQKANDPSCASILKMQFVDNRLCFELVAQFHGWIPIHEYSDEVFKLATYYNFALVVVELTGGLGRAVVERLKKDLFYLNIYRETSKPEVFDIKLGSQLGVDTNAYTKASMVAITQQVIQDKRIAIYCTETIKELVGFEQEKTDHGNIKYRGACGTHDDRVMSLVIGVSTAISSMLFNPGMELKYIDKKIDSPDFKKVSDDWRPILQELKDSEDKDIW